MPRDALRLLLCSLLISVATPSGLQSREPVTVGISVWTGYPENVRGFKESMAAAGFVEGESVKYLYGQSGIDKEHQRRIAEQFKEAGVDLVYSLTTPGTAIVKEVVPQDVPIVFSIVTYPADSGLIESFDYSGNNLVGTSNYVPLKHYVELLRNLVPDAASVAIFHRKGEPNSKIQAANMGRLLRRAGIRSIDCEADDLDHVRTIAEALAGEVDVFMTTTDTLMQGGGEQILIEVSRQHKIPILSSNKAGIEQGSTFGPVADFYTLGRMSGDMAVQILRGQALPHSLASRLQDPPLILVNRGSAENVGLSIPTGLPNIQFTQ